MKKIAVSLLAAALTVALAVFSSAKSEAIRGKVSRLDPALDLLVSPTAQIETLASGFDWVEGPVWRKSGDYLLFSDIPKNVIFRWKEGEGVSVFLRPAGFTEAKPLGRELGSNGLTFDSEDRLVIADHGNRRVARLNESNFTKTTLADRYKGKRLNTPNDLTYHSNGDLYFTDPPYGMDGGNKNPAKELSYNGVYRLRPTGELTLLTAQLSAPNGIALSPDEKTLYVAISDPAHAVWMAYDVEADGTIANERVFFDATAMVKAGKKGLPDGMKVDSKGNLFATGPGGVFIFSPDGRHLGTIETGEKTSNCAFGDNGSTLYMTADHALLRIQLKTKGKGF